MADVAIIGAGPGGSAAGILLARAGVSVCLIEQHRFPRDKVCGECISALGIEVLERLGLAALLRGLGPVTLRRTILHAPDGSSAEVRLPRPMWGISRLQFDQFLLEAARSAGATILQPARAEAIDADGRRPQVRLRFLQDNRVEVLECAYVILAAGKAALLPDPPPPTADLGIKVHFEPATDAGAAADAIELFGVGGHYGGIAPVEAGVHNLGFSVPAARLRHRGAGLRGLFDEISRQNPALRRRLRGARYVGAWMAAPLPRFGLSARWPAGVVPVGNAAAAIEPIGGEGMGLALASAELAAAAIQEAIAAGGELNTGRLRACYQKLWLGRRLACRAVALALSNPCLSGRIVSAVEGSEEAIRPLLGLMGKAP